MKRGIILDPKDNVGVVMSNINKGDIVEIEAQEIEALADIEMPHKIAIEDIASGVEIIKYGESMGYATVDIKKGDHVHVHNVDSEKSMK